MNYRWEFEECYANAEDICFYIACTFGNSNVYVFILRNRSSKDRGR